MFFLLTMCVSGIALNHREALRDLEISRSWLPPHYNYRNWNGGLLRGSATMGRNGSILYGNNGLWLARNGNVRDFNRGLPSASGRRIIRGVCKSAAGDLFAASTECVYRFDSISSEWETIELNIGCDPLTDITLKRDTLVVLGRSRLYYAMQPYRHFTQMELPHSDTGAALPSGFRGMWLLHSGQLFGNAGVAAADTTAIILLFLSVTGILIFLLPYGIRHQKGDKNRVLRLARWLKSNVKAHQTIGLWTLLFIALICLTGFCLRPPLLIPLAYSEVPEIPGTELCHTNPWHDKLRMIRHDSRLGWLLSTSDGFFRLDNLKAVPRKISVQPPVSIMGLNVFEQYSDTEWLCGSFSGLFRWNPLAEEVRDYYTGESVESKQGAPFGKSPIAGFLNDSAGNITPVLYDNGMLEIQQSEDLSHLPMPLWNLALEMHTGRLWFGNAATWFYIPIVGILVMWCLISGYKVSAKAKAKTKR